MTCALRLIRRSLLVTLAFTLPGFAKCPISDGATLVVRAAVGDLHVDTAGRDAVAEVQVENNAVQIQETCNKGVVLFTSNGPDPVRGTIAWRIVAPKTVILDLVTMAGSINVGDVDGDVVLRTAGGSAKAGHIKGRAARTSQSGLSKS